MTAVGRFKAFDHDHYTVYRRPWWSWVNPWLWSSRMTDAYAQSVDIITGLALEIASMKEQAAKGEP